MSQRETGSPFDRSGPQVPTAVFGDTPRKWDRAEATDRDIEFHQNGAALASVGANAELPSAERVRALARHAHSDSVAYQSVAVAGLQILERVLKQERIAAAAAISLAQRDKLDAMVCTLEETVAALRMSLSVQGSKMLFACTQTLGNTNPDERSWWFALTETIQALEDGIDAISGIVSGQPKGGASRTLSSVIARQLHRHHNDLLSEAEQWIG